MSKNQNNSGGGEEVEETSEAGPIAKTSLSAEWEKMTFEERVQVVEDFQRAIKINNPDVHCGFKNPRTQEAHEDYLICMSPVRGFTDIEWYAIPEKQREALIQSYHSVVRWDPETRNLPLILVSENDFLKVACRYRQQFVHTHQEIDAACYRQEQSEEDIEDELLVDEARTNIDESCPDEKMSAMSYTELAELIIRERRTGNQYMTIGKIESNRFERVKILARGHDCFHGADLAVEAMKMRKRKKSDEKAKRKTECETPFLLSDREIEVWTLSFVQNLDFHYEAKQRKRLEKRRKTEQKQLRAVMEEFGDVRMPWKVRVKRVCSRTWNAVKTPVKQTFTMVNTRLFLRAVKEQSMLEWTPLWIALIFTWYAINPWFVAFCFIVTAIQLSMRTLKLGMYVSAAGTFIVTFLAALFGLFVWLLRRKTGKREAKKGMKFEANWKVDLSKVKDAKWKKYGESGGSLSMFEWGTMITGILSLVGFAVMPFMGFLQAGRYASAANNLVKSAESLPSFMGSAKAFLWGFFAPAAEEIYAVYYYAKGGKLGVIMVAGDHGIPHDETKDWLLFFDKEKQRWMKAAYQREKPTEYILVHHSQIERVYNGQLDKDIEAARKGNLKVPRMEYNEKKGIYSELQVQDPTAANASVEQLPKNIGPYLPYALKGVMDTLDGALQDMEKVQKEDEAQAEASLAGSNSKAGIGTEEREYISKAQKRRSELQVDAHEKGKEKDAMQAKQQHYVTKLMAQLGVFPRNIASGKNYVARKKILKQMSAQEFHVAMNIAQKYFLKAIPQWGESQARKRGLFYLNWQRTMLQKWNDTHEIEVEVPEPCNEYTPERMIEGAKTFVDAANIMQFESWSDMKRWAKNKATQMREFGAAVRANCCGRLSSWWSWTMTYKITILMVILGVVACVSTIAFVYSRKKRKVSTIPGMKLEGLKDFTLEYDDGTVIPDESVRGGELRLDGSSKVFSLSGASDMQMLNALRKVGLSKGEYKGQLGHRTPGGFKFIPVTLRAKQDAPNAHQFEAIGTEAAARKFARAKAFARRREQKAEAPVIAASAMMSEAISEEPLSEKKEVFSKEMKEVIQDVIRQEIAKVVERDDLNEEEIEEMSHVWQEFAQEEKKDLVKEAEGVSWVNEALQTVEQHQRFIGFVQNVDKPTPYCNAVRIFDVIAIPAHVLDIMDADGCKVMTLAVGSDRSNASGYTSSVTLPYVRSEWTVLKCMVDTAVRPIPTSLCSWTAYGVERLVIPTVGVTRAKFYVRLPHKKGASSMDTVECTITERDGRAVVLYETDHENGMCFSTLNTDENPAKMFALHHKGGISGKLCEAVAITRAGLDEMQEIGSKGSLAEAKFRHYVKN